MGSWTRQLYQQQSILVEVITHLAGTLELVTDLQVAQQAKDPPLPSFPASQHQPQAFTCSQTCIHTYT